MFNVGIIRLGLIMLVLRRKFGNMVSMILSMGLIGRMILVDVDHIGKVLENGFTINWF